MFVCHNLSIIIIFINLHTSAIHLFLLFHQIQDCIFHFSTWLLLLLALVVGFRTFNKQQCIPANTSLARLWDSALIVWDRWLFSGILLRLNTGNTKKDNPGIHQPNNKTLHSLGITVDRGIYSPVLNSLSTMCIIHITIPSSHCKYRLSLYTWLLYFFKYSQNDTRYCDTWSNGIKLVTLNILYIICAAIDYIYPYCYKTVNSCLHNSSQKN